MTVSLWVKINNSAYWAGTHAKPTLTIDYDNGTTITSVATASTSWQLLACTFTPATTYGQIEKRKPTASDAYISHIETLVGKIIESNTTRGRPKKNIKDNKRENRKMYKNLVVLDKTKHKGLKVLVS